MITEKINTQNTVNCIEKFSLPPNSIYMCGHSLGPLPIYAEHYLNASLTQWKELGVKAWNDAKWMELPNIVSQKISSIINADPSEISVSDCTSVNLFKTIHSSLEINKGRNIILTSSDNFPADLYILQGISHANKNINIKTVPYENIMQNLNSDIAVLTLSHINYRNSSIIDTKELIEEAHKQGIIVVLDLSHSVGIFPLDMSDINTDFAVGCTYKYLNGGPGSPSFIYTNKNLFDRITSPIFGWIGHRNPFDFDPEYSSHGSSVFMSGTPYIMSLQVLNGALEIFDNISIQDVYNQCQLLSDIVIKHLVSEKISIESPLNSKHRGGHIAFTHPNGYAISRALIDQNVICDYREPSTVRLCTNPLYCDITSINVFADILKTILDEQLYLNPIYQTKKEIT